MAKHVIILPILVNSKLITESMALLLRQLVIHKVFIRYFISGLVVSVAELTFFAFLIYTLDVSYLLASTIIFLFGLVASFVLRKIWVFSHKSLYPGFKQLMIYSLIFCVSLGLNLLLMYILVDKLSITELLAQVISMFLIGFFNYTANKTITFKKLPTKELTLTHYIAERKAHITN